MLFRPEGLAGHAVVDVKPIEIAVITDRVIRVNASRVIDDYRKRQQPRFRLDSLREYLDLTIYLFITFYYCFIFIFILYFIFYFLFIFYFIYLFFIYLFFLIFYLFI